VVSLRGVRLIVFLSELNELELWQTDIGNAYLEAKTKEKVYVIAGPEFGKELEGHLLVIVRALYSLKTSRAPASVGMKLSVCKGVTERYRRRYIVKFFTNQPNNLTMYLWVFVTYTSSFFHQPF